MNGVNEFKTSAEEFGNLIHKVQSTISNGIERGISTAMQASAAVQGMVGNTVNYPVATGRSDNLWSNRSLAGSTSQPVIGKCVLPISVRVHPLNKVYCDGCPQTKMLFHIWIAFYAQMKKTNA